MTRDWIVWLRCLMVGHIWCYAHHGPPVQDWGGPWYNCVRCNGYGRGGLNPMVPWVSVGSSIRTARVTTGDRSHEDPRRI